MSYHCVEKGIYKINKVGEFCIKCSLRLSDDVKVMEELYNFKIEIKHCDVAMLMPCPQAV